MRTIVRQTSVGVIEQALQIEQRSYVRIRLPVVVTEQAFVITGQAREHVGSDELIVISKPLRSCEFEGPIKTLGATETTRCVHRPIWIHTAGASLLLSGARLVAPRVEQEVIVAIIE